MQPLPTIYRTSDLGDTALPLARCRLRAWEIGLGGGALVAAFAPVIPLSGRLWWLLGPWYALLLLVVHFISAGTTSALAVRFARGMAVRTSVMFGVALAPAIVAMVITWTWLLHQRGCTTGTHGLGATHSAGVFGGFCAALNLCIACAAVVGFFDTVDSAKDGVQRPRLSAAIFAPSVFGCIAVAAYEGLTAFPFAGQFTPHPGLIDVVRAVLNEPRSYLLKMATIVPATLGATVVHANARALLASPHGAEQRRAREAVFMAALSMAFVHAFDSGTRALFWHMADLDPTRHLGLTLAITSVAIAPWLPSCVLALHIGRARTGRVRRAWTAAAPLLFVLGVIAVNAAAAHAEQPFIGRPLTKR